MSDNLASALVAAQAAMPTIHKDSRAEVPTKSGGKFSYTYLSLPALLDAVRPVLNDHGLALTQCPSLGPDGRQVLTSVLLHATGEKLTFETPLNGDMSTPQAWGSVITYARRYAVTALLGLAADEDDDGATASASPKKAGGGKPTPKGGSASVAGNDNAPSPKLLEQIDQAVDEYASLLGVDRAKVIEKIGATPMTEQWRTSEFSAELALKRLQDKMKSAAA